MKTLVIDLYHADKVLDFASVKSSGVVGVIHKASQGKGMTDQAYAVRRKLATDAGLLWGAYHFMDLSDPTAQAQQFLDRADPDDTTLMALDWENIKGTSPTTADARTFIEAVEDGIGHQCVIYSGNVAKERITGNDPFFGARRLWLAEYGDHWKVQESWKAPWLWQFSETGQVPGIRGNCDINAITDPMTQERLIAEWAK
jgi:lysozyme